MKLAFVISLLLAAVVVRSPKDAANTGKSLTAVQPLAVKARPIADLAPPLAPTVPKTVYVAATAYDEFGIESDYSPELATFYTNNQLSVIWDPSPILDLGGYKLYWGTNAGVYYGCLNAGTSLWATFPPVPVLPSTQYFKLFAQVSTNGLNSFADASPSPFLTVTQVSGASGPPETLWRLRIAVTNAP